MPSLRAQRIHVVLGSVLSFAVAVTGLHCAAGGSNDAGGTGGSSSTGSGSGSFSAGPGVGGGISVDAPVKDYSAEDFFEDDPPPTGCDGGGVPPIPGGTPECPADKNLEGCDCFQKDQTAPCWPGKRKNRNRGICHDGTTTCTLQGENTLRWGPCVGYQLPTGTTGKEACLCFSGGHWEIDNLSPCFFTINGVTNVAVSTTLVNGQPQCPPDVNMVPSQPWSTTRLTVDCGGYFKLCYSIKAGDGANPQPTDCEIVKVCTEAYYTTPNMPQDFPVLPAWLTGPAQATCVEQFVATGGYGEMSVVGESDECDQVNKVFNHVTYCPLECNDPMNMNPICQTCMPGGGGGF
jgi:hypothetical protein